MINVEAADKPALAMEKFRRGTSNAAGSASDKNRFVFHSVFFLVWLY